MNLNLALESAKKNVIIEAETLLNRSGTLDALAKEAFYKTEFKIDGINSVTAKQIETFVGKATKAKPSVVASGNLSVLPYADEI